MYLASLSLADTEAEMSASSNREVAYNRANEAFRSSEYNSKKSWIFEIYRFKRKKRKTTLRVAKNLLLSVFVPEISQRVH